MAGSAVEGELFAAKVLTALASGKLGVEYEMGGNVGIFLTAEEHGLKVLPDTKKRKQKKPVGRMKKVCSVEGCPNKVVARGLCGKHGGRNPRPVEASPAKPRARGLSGKHGGVDNKCKASGCTNADQKGGYCDKHGGKDGLCAGGGCTTAAVAGGLTCAKHGADGVCTDITCTRNARKGKKVCYLHSAQLKPCSVTGCSGFAHARGRCKKHGASGFCSTKGCDTAVRARGLCHIHGAKGFCSFSKCTTAVKQEVSVQGMVAAARRHAE